MKKSRKEEITSVFEEGGREMGEGGRKECEKYERVRSIEKERESL